MRATRLAVAALLVLGVASCGSAQPPESGKTIMSNVTGKQLDVAESDIEHAGYDSSKIKIVGGGTLGVVVKSNWQVCAQTPAAGEVVTSAPELTVDRSCAKSSMTPNGTQSPSEPAPTQSTAETTLTIANSKDLAQLLAVPDSCSDTVRTFASKYEGRNIEFDGSISAMANHGSYHTRYDILIGPGDKGAETVVGPGFKFRDVNPANDLHLTGIGVGTKLHLVAQVGSYDATACLLYLEPVSTQAR